MIDLFHQPSMTNKIHTKIRNCQDIEYLSSLVTKYLKLGDTTDKLHDISGQRIFKKEQVKLYNEVIGSLLSDVFRRHRVPYSQSIYSKYDLTKPTGDLGRAADCSLAEEVLGWKPKVSLQEGLRITYEWAEQFLKSYPNICK